jgi:hypothetical protein
LERQRQKIQDCRNIVKEILNFGVDEKQKMTIIKMLSYELENHQHCVQLVDMLKEMDNDYFFIKGDE